MADKPIDIEFMLREMRRTECIFREKEDPEWRRLKDELQTRACEEEIFLDINWEDYSLHNETRRSEVLSPEMLKRYIDCITYSYKVYERENEEN